MRRLVSAFFGIFALQAKSKYRDLSTARRTMRLSAAPVEMTYFSGWVDLL